MITRDRLRQYKAAGAQISRGKDQRVNSKKVERAWEIKGLGRTFKERVRTR